MFTQLTTAISFGRVARATGRVKETSWLLFLLVPIWISCADRRRICFALHAPETQTLSIECWRCRTGWR